MNIFIAFLAGLAAGVISAWGIGGGSLLMIFMTVVALIPQQAAQGINLLYFIPTSITALCSHIKNKLVQWEIVIPAAVSGSVITALSALLATSIDVAVLKKIFGVFIIFIGISEILCAIKKT